MRLILKQHNKVAYERVMAAFERDRMTCVCHPTGTGKSYIIAAVTENFKRVLILAPNNFVLNQIKTVMGWHKGADYMTYAMLTRRGVEKQYDLIVLDEFHRAGADEWGDAVMLLLSQQTDAKVFGTTATPVRHLDGERDMSDELFNRNVASEINIGEAWSRNILPIPTYVTGLFDFTKTVSETGDRIRQSKYLTAAEKNARLERLAIADAEWQQSEGMPSVLRKHIDKECRRVLVFCTDVPTLTTMGDVVRTWFEKAGLKVNDVFILHNELTDRQQRDAMKAFESDNGEGCKIMMSVDMLNEGVHVPRVGAVLMLRTTRSRIVFMQQMGRCLTAANTERPVILDMVDNIKNVSAIHEFKRDFDQAELLRVENEGKEATVRNFRIYDYTKTVNEVIKQLQQGTGREYLTTEEIRQQIRDFAAEHDRWPSQSTSGRHSRYEMLLGRRFHNNREALLTDPSFSALFEYYRTKDLPVFEEYLKTVIDFCEEFDHIPYGTEDDRKAMNCWIWLRKWHGDDERVKAIQRQYSQRILRDDEIKRRVELLAAFIKEHHRLPHGKYGESKLCTYLNALRATHTDHEAVQALFRLIEEECHRPEPEENILAEFREFCLKNKRIPSRFSKDPDEVSLYKRARGRKALRTNPEYIRLNEKYKKRRMDDDEEKRIVTEHCQRTGRLPSKQTCDDVTYRAWQNIKRTDKAFADSLRNQYEPSHIWDDEETRRHAAEMMEFITTNNRRPNARLGEKRLCNMFSTLTKHKADHPAVIPLLEAIKRLPKADCHVTKFTQQQHVRRKCAVHNYGYIVIPRKEATEEQLYVVYYNEQTRRSEQFEQLLHEAGLSVQAWR